jgi:hypothetical protein
VEAEVALAPPLKPEREIDLPEVAPPQETEPPSTAEEEPQNLIQTEQPSASAEGAQASPNDLVKSLQEQIRPCWSPAGGKGPSVLVAVTLNRNGSVARAVVNNRGKGGDSAYRALADRAHGAILRCGPYRLPGEAYALWRELEVEFFAP